MRKIFRMFSRVHTRRIAPARSLTRRRPADEDTQARAVDEAHLVEIDDDLHAPRLDLFDEGLLEPGGRVDVDLTREGEDAEVVARARMAMSSSIATLRFLAC